MAPTSVRSIEVVGHDNDPTAGSTSIADLISTVPQAWRAIAGSRLTTVYRVAMKLCNVQNTIVQYERHAAEGSFPGSINNSLKEPSLQFSKEFLGTETGTKVKGLLGSVVSDARKSLLNCALLRKKEELSELQSLTKFDVESWRKMVGEVAERAAQTYGSAVHYNVKSGSVPKWGEGTPELVIKDCELLWRGGQVWHYRAIGLARSISDRSLVEKTKMLTLKKETDVAMKDADTELSTRDVVREELSAQLKALKSELSQSLRNGKKPGKQQPKGKKSGSNAQRVTKGSSKNGGKKGKGRK